jgi:hypothetical protein
LSETATFNDLGTTEMIVRTTRIMAPLGVTIPPPVETTLEVKMTTRTVHIEIIGGAPGRDGSDGSDGRDGADAAGAVDPGDLTLYFENGLT